jgi:hypothetical protein
MVILKPQSIGFERVEVSLLTGGSISEWQITQGKYSGLSISSIVNPHWFAFSIWRLKSFPAEAVPPDLLKALREQWLSVYEHNIGREVDPSYLDRLDPSVPFDWSESPPSLEDVGKVTEGDAVDEAPSQPLFPNEEMPDWLK